MKSSLIPALFFCLLLSIHSSSLYSADLEKEMFAGAQQEILKIAQINLKETSLPQVDVLILQVQGYLAQGRNCIYAVGLELEQIDKALAALGEKVPGESREISKERIGLQTLKNQAEVRLAQCRLLTLRAEDLDRKLNENKRQAFTRDLFSRGPGVVELVRKPALDFSSWPKAVTGFLSSGAGLAPLTPYNVVFVLLLAGLGLFLGNRIDSLVFRQADRIKQEGFFFDLLRILSLRKKTFQLLGALGGISLSLHFLMKDLQPPSCLPSAVNSIILVLVLSGFGRIYGKLLATEHDEASVANSPTVRVIRFHLLTVFFGLLFFVFTSPLRTILPETVFFLLRALVVTLWYGGLLWVLWLFSSYSRFQLQRRIVRLFLVFMLGGVVLAELSGYRILAGHLLEGTCGTVVLVFLLSLCVFSVNELVGGFGRGRYPWQQALRKRLGVETGHVLKGVIWTGTLLKLSLLLVFLYFVLRLWGISSIYASAFYDWLVDGFSVGTIRIVPSRVGLGFFILALGWNVVTLVKGKIIRKWLAESELAPSMQDAFSTVLGYVAYSLVILLGLSTSGISFSGLAIVAGALSVGIGFGLQNIVNNLVSGLILLFERPIKRGDWIVVGTTEGYVKKISVRSTIIQTFDRSDVIVPNSELISSQVTNMMLLDIRGRLKVAVGVAYGSDTGLVKQLLLEVAQEHPEVITNGTVPYPVVRFQGFGESSLDFELFCHLRDVDKRIDVRSDMHFAIEKAFRDHGVEIPFPQRDIHIRSGLHLERKNEAAAGGVPETGSDIAS